MSSLIDPLNKSVHDVAQALIDQDITTKLATMVTTPINSGFSILADVLGIVSDLTAPPAPPTP
jgi:hypothetical protein